MPVYFDDIPLGTDPEIMRAFLGKYLPVERIHYFDWMTSIPPVAGHFIYSGLPYPRISIGSVNWPSGVCQFGVAAFVATQYEVNFFRNSIYANGYARDGTLLFSDGEDEQEFTMRLLPPVPLAQIYGETDFSRSVSAGFPAGTTPNSNDFTSLLTGSTNAEALKYGNLWLLIFVDKRYFWWRRWPDFSDLNSPYLWSWSDVFDRLGDSTSGLDCTISANEPHPAYGLPSEQLKVSSIPGPLLAEAIARASGQIAWVSPDGTLNFTRAGNAIVLSDDLWDTYSDRLVAGGRIRVAKRVCSQPWLSYDQIGLFPEYVDVHFQKKRGASVTLQTYKSSVEVASNLPPEAYQGFEGTNTGDRQQLMASLLAETNGSTITNQTALDQCAVQMTKDWLIMQMSATHATFAGVCPIDGTPFDDICWVHSLSDDGGSKIVTRVTRSPINEINSGSPSVALATPDASAVVRVIGEAEDGFYPGSIVQLRTLATTTTTSTSSTSTTTTTYCPSDPTSSTTSTTTSTTTTGCPTTTSTTTTTTTTPAGTTTSTTTTTTTTAEISQCDRWPSVGDGEQDCWIIINDDVDGPVPTDGSGIYSATYAGTRDSDGLPVFVVSDVCATGNTTTTPAPSCSGTCRWSWNIEYGYWERDLYCCERISEDIEQCYCEYPRFCGTEDCSETVTQCTERYPQVFELNCPTSSSTTSTTVDPGCAGQCKWLCYENQWSLWSSTCTADGDCGCVNPASSSCTDPEVTVTGCVSGGSTTTTPCPEQDACTGTCVWKYFFGWFLVGGGCSTYSNCNCSQPSAGNLCDVDSTPCERPNDPPCSPCTGQCDWIWNDVVNPPQWNLVSWGCANSSCCPCNCPYPSVDGIDCGDPITTFCGCEPGGTTQNPCETNSTSTTTSTTCAPGECCGQCYWQWDSGGGDWVSLGGDVNCISCDCVVKPFYDGQNDCELATIPCAQTTTSTTTTSTTTTTTTTCLTPCQTACDDCCCCDCVWNGSSWQTTGCIPCGLYSGSGLTGCEQYDIVQLLFCNQCSTCDCSQYTQPGYIGQRFPGVCDGTTTTMTTSTTTSTTTTAGGTCGGYCVYQCVSGAWVLRTNACDDPSCECEAAPGGSCIDRTNYYSNCTDTGTTPAPTTTTSTTTTTTTTGACSGCWCVWRWDGSSWVKTQDCVDNKTCLLSGCSCSAPGSTPIIIGAISATQCS